MGTTRIKVIDLSSQEQEIKTSRKHAEKLTGAVKIKEEKKPKEAKGPQETKETGQSADQKIAAPMAEAPAPPSQETPKPKLAKTPASFAKRGELTQRPKHHRSKKYQEVSKLTDKSKIYPAREALELLAKTSITRFDPTVEVHLNVTDKNIRAKINFPHPVGRVKKTKRYLIFSDAPSVITKNIIWGNVSTIAEIESGKLKPGRDFDTVITTPGFMPHLAKVAKILGPKGMMPNPKNGTIQEDPTYALTQSDDSYELKTDPAAPIIHTKIGKLSDKPGVLEENLKALITAVGPTKIRKAVIKSTMSPAIKLDVATIAHLA